ncbi:NAD(P)H-binding protein [Reinekea sp. G2M2-21]|uniref:NAD(P)H-binding protein n=1 Tax=Reinekea sp. G2M2-21 TaxID=2788942 RepID=UPI0018A9AF4F|nr:NAD(P)H-binding protein [Reinekea sp. G2M2-21]
MSHMIVAGSTGLIGSHIAQQLTDPQQRVTLLSRRKISPPHVHQQTNIDYFTSGQLPASTSIQDTVFCALGTTIKKAGSKPAFEQVDLTLVVELATAAKAAGFKKFVVVSSLGVKPDTTNFYLATKAKMEAALTDLGFASLVIVRPSLLLGQRSEFRMGERFAEFAATLLSPLFKGKLARYKPVQAEDVARAMIHLATHETTPVSVVESESIQQLAAQ